MDDETEIRIVEKAEYVEAAVTVPSHKQSLDRERYLDDREQRDVDDGHVYRHLQEDLDWFSTYLREVRDALDPDSPA